jgi:4-amino-4-deoxy-L-arabinose transferase-like glycosyltransferase
MEYNPGHAATSALRRRRVSRRAVALFFLSVAVIYYTGLGTLPLLEPDEGRYAEIPREMLARGDFVTPHLNGVVYLEKPPLLYWGNAVSFAIFGESEFSARLFTATVSIAGVLLTYWMGAVLAGPRAGLFSAMVLCTSLYHYVVGRINTLDMTLAVTMIVAIFPAFLYLSGKRESRRYLLLSYAGAALAFLAKGLIGIVFPAAILLLWLLLSRRHREIGKAVSLTGLALFLAIALPWVVLVQRANPDFLWFFFVREHFLRFTTKMHHRYQPFWFFFPFVIGGLLPWLAFVRRAVRAAWEARDGYLTAEDRRFMSLLRRLVGVPREEVAQKIAEQRGRRGGKG